MSHYSGGGGGGGDPGPPPSFRFGQNRPGNFTFTQNHRPGDFRERPHRPPPPPSGPAGGPRGRKKKKNKKERRREAELFNPDNHPANAQSAQPVGRLNHPNTAYRQHHLPPRPPPSRDARPYNDPRGTLGLDTPNKRKFERDRWSPPPVRPLATIPPPHLAGRLIEQPRHKARKVESLSLMLGAWEPKPNTPTTPWTNASLTSSLTGFKKLHREILSFFEYAKPRPLEIAQRHAIVARLRDALDHGLLDMGPGPDEFALDIFGSVATQCFLPTADMDLVVISNSYLNHDCIVLSNDFSGPAKRRLKSLVYNLTEVLRRKARNLARPGSVQPIAKARVPIVKYIDGQTGIPVDVSFENKSGSAALAHYKQWATTWPEFQPMVLLLKQFLKMRDIDEVHTGGFGGLTISCLVVHVLQLTDFSGVPEDERLATVLVRLLHYYGSFDHSKGISVVPPMVFPKDQAPFEGILPPRSNTSVMILNPNHPHLEIAGGSQKGRRIFDLFGEMSEKLEASLLASEEAEGQTKSILDFFIGGDYSSYDRQRERLEQLSSVQT